MKGKKIREFLKKKKVIGCAVLAAAVIIGGASVWQSTQEVEFPSYVDPILEVSLEEEETPLASAPKVTTKTTKKKSTKKVKLKKASKKTYTKKLATKTKKSTSTTTSGNQTVKTEKKVVTATTEKYTKKKKYKKVTTVVTTTTTTTTTTNESADETDEDVEGVADEASTETVNSTDSSTAKTASTTQKYEVAVATIAPNMDSRVLSAYTKLGFKVYVDPSVTSYSGYFDAKSQSITLRSQDSTIYHELGHFLAFIAGNYDKTNAFASVYSSEKGLYTGINKAYVTQSASEYFAESVRDYITDASSLKTNRPKTYAAVETALNKITDAQVAKIQKIYGSYWS